MSRTYRKADVQQHAVGYYGGPLPAVNIKVYGSIWDIDPRTVTDDPAFTRETVEALAAKHEDDADLFNLACEAAWDQLVLDAADVFGPYVKVWQEGRSGGWAVVDGLAPIEEWDAIALGKWRKFEGMAKAEAADVPWRMLDRLYFEWSEDRAAAAARVEHCKRAWSEAFAASLGVDLRAAS